jgi:DNA-binding NtrC family response regulator
MVRQGQFREDLFYRLTTISLHLPPLRQRTGDVALLATYFLAQANERRGRTRELGAAAVEALERHAWPGNVRELKHAIEAAVLVCDGAEIGPEHLPASVRRPPDPLPGLPPADLPTLEALERDHIRRVLDAVHDHRAQAARILGISERNLYRKLRDYGWLT